MHSSMSRTIDVHAICQIRRLHFLRSRPVASTCPCGTKLPSLVLSSSKATASNHLKEDITQRASSRSMYRQECTERTANCSDVSAQQDQPATCARMSTCTTSDGWAAPSRPLSGARVVTGRPTYPLGLIMLQKAAVVHRSGPLSALRNGVFQHPQTRMPLIHGVNTFLCG
jgi:hypothetical protein